MPKTKRILAIDPGTREMGVAVLENGNLLYAGVESFRKLPSPNDRLRQACAAVSRLIHDFRPGVLVVEKNFVGSNRCAALLNALSKQIAALARHHRVPIVSLAPNTVKKTVAGDGWATKEEVAQAVATWFPKLMAFLPPERTWKRRNLLNMFDAVALGATFRQTAGTPRNRPSPRKIRAP